MKPAFLPRLVNGPFADPVLFVQFRYRRRALLFDLGAIDALSNREVLSISEVFISHCHMDHFYGFERLLRVSLARTRCLRLFGPEGFTDRLGHRLQGYTWNLVDNYREDQWLEAAEWKGGGELEWTRFSLKARFRPIAHWRTPCIDGVIWDEPAFRVRARVLAHGDIPVLAFALEESRHVNVWKNRLSELDLPTGPWLRELKEAVLSDVPPETMLSVPTRNRVRRLTLGWLRERVLRVVPGMRLAYVVDCRYEKENARRIEELAERVDWLFIEAPFLGEEVAMAAQKAHLTARQAGELARRAGVIRLVPLHFSPRHEGAAERIFQEVCEAAGAEVRCLPPSRLHAPSR